MKETRKVKKSIKFLCYVNNMKLGRFGRALLAVGGLAALGQQAVATNIPLENRLNYAAQAQATGEDTQILFYRLLRDIRTKEEELKGSYTSPPDLQKALGLLVYDDINELASRFGTKICLDNGLLVFSMGESSKTDEIVVMCTHHYSGNAYSARRIVFYSDKSALEDVFYYIGAAPRQAMTGTASERFFDFDYDRKSLTKLRIVSENCKDVVKDETGLYNQHFAYVPDMKEFDFQKIYWRVNELESQLNRIDFKNIYKWDYIKVQLMKIADGLFERYGGRALISLDIFANKGFLSVGGYGATSGDANIEIEEYKLSLAIRESGEAGLSVNRVSPFKLWPTYDIVPGSSIDEIVSNIIAEK